MDPIAIRCVIPSRIAMGEPFSVKVKVLGPVRKIDCSGNFCDRKPALHSPFNLNVSRQIQYHDNCLPDWSGKIQVDAGKALSGPTELLFDGHHQGVFPGDTRPIRVFNGFSLNSPGFHFIRLIDKVSGVTGVSNPIYVTEQEPNYRIFWGDPHWQTFFSDGIRCPEELYSFARDEAFLDFGAISDHMEAVTDRQWEYFQAVTNDFNEPGRFATLIGQEWTHHHPTGGAPGHRNIYYSGNGGPVLRSTDPDCDTLTKLWRKLDSIGNQEAIAIPHHIANVIMGIDWQQGWNPKYEKAVEIHSVWGSSEKHKDDGNLMPIEHCKGERRGRHVIDGLKLGYRFGFVGGGDIHDGRPGDQLHTESYPPQPARFWPSGYTAILDDSLSRNTVFNAIKNRKTYATTASRIYLDVNFQRIQDDCRVEIKSASEEGLSEVAIVRNGIDVLKLEPGEDSRIISNDQQVPMKPGDFCYVRVTTGHQNLAWSSPYWA
jgi:hypothetical protein